MKNIQFEVKEKLGSYSLKLDFDELFAIGYAGRATRKTMEHIQELA